MRANKIAFHRNTFKKVVNCEYYMGKDKQIGKIISLIKAYSRFGDYGDTALLTVLVIRTISTN